MCIMQNLVVSNSFSPSLGEIIAFLAVLLTAISIYYKIKSNRITKPKITHIESSSTGSRVTITVINFKNYPITVEDHNVFISKPFFRFFYLKKQTAKLWKKNNNLIVIPPDSNVRDNIEIVPPEGFYFSTYKILVKSSNGWCSAIYNPDSVSGISQSLVAEHRVLLKSKRNWLRRKLNL